MSAITTFGSFVSTCHVEHIEAFYGVDFLRECSTKISFLLSIGALRRRDAIKELMQLKVAIAYLCDHQDMSHKLTYVWHKFHIIKRFLDITKDLLTEAEYQFFNQVHFRFLFQAIIWKMADSSRSLACMKVIDTKQDLIDSINKCEVYRDIYNLFRSTKISDNIGVLRNNRDYLMADETNDRKANDDQFVYRNILMALDVFNALLNVLFGCKNIYENASNDEKATLRSTLHVAFESCVLFYRILCLRCYHCGDHNGRQGKGAPWYNRSAVNNEQVGVLIKDACRDVDTIDSLYVDVCKRIFPSYLTHFYPCLPCRFIKPADDDKMKWKIMYIHCFQGENVPVWMSFPAQ